MSASWPHESFFFLSPLIYNYLDIHNQAQVILHSTPGYLRDHPICTFENGWIGPRRKLQSQGSGGIGYGNLAGREGGGWRKWVGIFPVIHAAAGGTHYSLWGETAVPGEREGKGKKRTEENAFLSICPEYSKRSANKLLGLPNSRITVRDDGHIQSPCAKHTSLSTLLPTFSFFFLFLRQLVFTGSLPTLAANQL